jgi:hypothetical protein
LNEKGIDTDDTITAQGASGANMIPVSALVAMMKSTTAAERAAIRKMLIKIDFVAPGRKPVLDYFAHLGQAVAI